RASRAIGSSGDLFGSFWVSKRNTQRQKVVKTSKAPQGGAETEATDPSTYLNIIITLSAFSAPTKRKGQNMSEN
ncbi:hypothetical protein, partial [uncultured Gemmiger sp.]|uniref:hypothetical protein n=1 Tax=uncultured Gemmiger sp. TaxID=1623490 RepID=UPI0025E0E685